MKTEFEMSKADLEVAVREYFVKRGIPELTTVTFKSSPRYGYMDTIDGYDVNATVSIDMTLEQFLTRGA